MKFTFKGEIFPKAVLNGVDTDRHEKRFRIQIKNNQITVEYSGDGQKEDRKKQKPLLKTLLKKLHSKPIKH